MGTIKQIFIFVCLIQIVLSFWWPGTTTTPSTTQNPYENWITTDEFYIQDRILQHQLVLPGTKYCGPGNRSEGLYDLGHFRNVDLCCRDHDLCPDNISAGKYKHGLHNSAKYTKSHCGCDTIFHNCLKSLGSPPSRIVGYLYFTLFHIDCYKKDFPIIECSRRRHRRCLEYKLNRTAPPIYQWFDNPFFRHWIELFPAEYFMNLSTIQPPSTSYYNDTNDNITVIFDELTITEATIFLNMTNFNISTNNTTTSISTNESTFASYFETFYTAVINYLQNLTTFAGKDYYEYNYYNISDIDSVGNVDANITNSINEF